MTTVPADPLLDVSSRLANLRTWQTEWQRIDRELEEQVSLLDGNNLLELQQVSPYLQCATTYGHDSGQATTLHS